MLRQYEYILYTVVSLYSTEIVKILLDSNTFDTKLMAVKLLEEGSLNSDNTQIIVLLLSYKDIVEGLGEEIIKYENMLGG